HAVEHPAVRRLQTGARVGPRPSEDYAHRVIHVRTLHFVFDVDGVQLRDEICHHGCFGIWGLGLGIGGIGDRRSGATPAWQRVIQSPTTNPQSPLRYTSRFLTSSALSSMNLRRGST